MIYIYYNRQSDISVLSWVRIMSLAKLLPINFERLCILVSLVAVVASLLEGCYIVSHGRALNFFFFNSWEY